MSSFPSTLMKIAACAPLPLAHAAGALLGWAMYGLSPTYRRHLRDNLAAGGYTDAATRRAAIASAGKLLAELPAVWLRTRKQVAALVTEIRGLELVEAARAQGKGIVFLTPHLGCFEVTAQVAAERFPITVLYSPPKLQWLRPIMEQGRGGENVRLASADLSGVRELLAALKRREAVGILPDQVPGEGEGEWSESLASPA
ncbi:MAG: lysophospholipid acyltransferase family protein, partial [Betaproteobacteria bacterium]|nr:lysophospholipid acyltransferase family protein [Betaproteobacteria bacterium]